MLENASATFSTSSNPITFTDSAASGTSDSLTLSVLDGKLTLGATGGITVLAGGNGTSSMTITGTLANLNAAVNGLVYTPRSGFTGTDTLSISVKDSNDNGTGFGQRFADRESEVDRRGRRHRRDCQFVTGPSHQRLARHTDHVRRSDDPIRRRFRRC